MRPEEILFIFVASIFYMKHLIFDCDGVLVDSEILASEVSVRMLRPYGYEADALAHCHRFAGMLDTYILEVLQEELGFRFPDDFYDRLQEVAEHAFDTELKEVPGMPSMVARLPHLKSVASNSQVPHVQRALRMTRLEVSFGGRIFSSQHVAKPKPAPDVYLYALQQQGLSPSDALVIEDSPTGVQAARGAGLEVIGFLGATHIGPGHADRLREKGATWIARDADELFEIIQGNG